jgi:hypothetical protein
LKNPADSALPATSFGSRRLLSFATGAAVHDGVAEENKDVITTPDECLEALLHNPSIPQALHAAAAQLAASVPFAARFITAGIAPGYDVSSLSDGRPDVPRSFEWITPRDHAALCAAGDALWRCYSALAADHAAIAARQRRECA